MAEQVQQTTVNSFVRGLFTEATPLTYPKDFSTDELNCELERTGVRRRREGIELEDNSSLSSFVINKGDLVHTEDWKNVGNISGTEFLVLQVRDILYFYDKSSQVSSGGEKGFSVDLRDFDAGTSFSVAKEKISATSVKGKLIVVSRAIDPFFVEFDSSADTISTEKINPRVRDFEWQGDESTYFKDEANPTDERKYDTFNSGWPDFPLKGHADAYITKTGKWPRLTHPWWTGGDTSDSDVEDRIFEAAVWDGVYGGTSLSGNGHFILDLFNKDRAKAVADADDVSYSVTLTPEVEPSRFSTTTTFAGRVWFSGLSGKKNSSKVFFSKVVQSNADISKFYQVGDPTSEHDPDLVDSDGGVIDIPEAAGIEALFPFGDRVLVFAKNGVWEIGGVDSVFKASQFFVSRATGAEGLVNRETLVNAQGTPFWWSDTAIYTIVNDEVSGKARGEDISKQSIQTFWNNIGGDKRLRAIGTYDPADKRIYWAYEKSDETIKYKYNRVLVLDLSLKAFIPWRFQDEETNTDYVVGFSHFDGFDSTEETNNVEADGDQVQVGGVDVVVTSDSTSQQGPQGLKYLVRDGDTGKLTFGSLKNTEFKDWGTASFVSYAETIYEFDGDLTTRKNNIFVTCYFEKLGVNGEDFVKSYSAPTSDIKMASACVPAPGSTGTHDVTIAGLGWTPKAARVVYYASGMLIQANGAVGVTDGTNQWCVSFKAESGSIERRVAATTGKLIIGIDGQGATLPQTITFLSFIENGMRLEYEGDFPFFVTFFGGEDFQSEAGVVGLTGTDEITVTTGFKTDAGFFMSPSTKAFDGTVSGSSYFFVSHGYLADTDPSIDPQVASVYWSNDDEPVHYLDPGSNRVHQRVSTSSVSEHYVAIEEDSQETYPDASPFIVSDLDDTSFKVSTTAYTDPNLTILSNDRTFYLGYFVMNLGDGNAWVDVVDSPTSTGSWSLNNPGFQPFYTEFCNTNMEETDVLEELTPNGRTGSMSISGVAGTDLWGAAWWIESKEGTDLRTRDTKRDAKCQEFVVYANDGGTLETRGDTPSITSTGVDFNITSTSSTVRKWPVIFIG